MAERSAGLRTAHRAAWSLLAAGLALACLACDAWLRRGGQRQGRPPWQRQRSLVSRSQGSDNGLCSEYPHLELEMPRGGLHSHVGNNTSQHDQDEGLVYRIFELGPSAVVEPGRDILMMVSGSNVSYTGMQDEYGSINLMPGSQVDLDFCFIDKNTMERVAMPKLAFTFFFNLVAGKNGTSMESVAVGGFKQHYLTDDTEVLVEAQPDGRMKFSATAHGIGNDTPEDPKLVTTQQNSRAVTLGFEGVTMLQVTFSVGPGSGPQFLTFLLKPSVMCSASPAGVMQDRRLARLPSLKVSASEEVYFAPQSGDWTFEAWDVHVGDEVARGDPLALVRNTGSGELRTIRAAKSGHVTKTQGYLRRGDVIKQVTEDGGLAAVGKFKEPYVGFYEVAVRVPDVDSVFNFWMVVEGDKVNFGDPIAQVTGAARGSHRSQEGDGNDTETQPMLIRAPVAGWVEHTAVLLRGVSFRKQLAGSSVATIRVALPWWMPVVALCLVCAIWSVPSAICCLKSLQRPRAGYQPMQQ